MRRVVVLRALPATLVLTLSLAASAGAYTTAPGVEATDFATGFPSQDGIGPVGITLDAAGRPYVADGGTIYRFGPGGGTAGPSTQLNATPIAGRLTGLAFGRDGRLYAARRTGARSGGVLEIDQDSGAVLRTVASNLPCPTGLAADPQSGDLFVSTVDCGPGVLRLARPARGAASVTAYVTGIAADGLTFDRDGTLYVAHAPDARGATVSEVAGTTSPSPGERRSLVAVPGADGTALGTPATTEGTPPFLVVNRHDGTITRVELDGSGRTTDLVAGGTRGDLSAVGPDGCLYATQTDTIMKVSAAGGRCHAPSGAGDGAAGAWPQDGLLGAGLVPTTPPLRPAARQFLKSLSSRCGTRRSVTLRFRAPGGVALRRARVLLGRRVVGRLGARALRRPVVLRGMPRGAFRLTIVGTTRGGRRVVLHRRIGACRG
jgi:sugar lactone lactonase YvrE